MTAIDRIWGNPAMLIAIGATLVLVLLTDQIGDIGRRIPYVFLVLWFGSATIVALVFVPQGGGNGEQADAPVVDRDWKNRMVVAGLALVPLAPVPLLEIQRTNHDPMVWLMEIALLISLCSTPFFSVASRSVISAAVLTWGAVTALLIPCATVLFQKIEHTEMAKDVPTVDTTNTMHAFFAPEYRYLFYILAGGVVFLYCPVMLFMGYRTFLRRNGCQTSR